jgi:hypothetical protein
MTYTISVPTESNPLNKNMYVMESNGYYQLVAAEYSARKYESKALAIEKAKLFGIKKFTIKKAKKIHERNQEVINGSTKYRVTQVKDKWHVERLETNFKEEYQTKKGTKLCTYDKAFFIKEFNQQGEANQYVQSLLDIKGKIDYRAISWGEEIRKMDEYYGTK